MANKYHTNEIQQMAASLHPGECYAPTPYKSNTYPRDGIIFPPIHPVFASGIESYLDPKYATDPAAFASRLPYFPFHAAYGMYEFEPAFIRKRNERERQRVKLVNEGYTNLREHLPDEFAEKRLSKVETLRGAIQYIKHLQQLLGVEKEKNEAKSFDKNCATKKQDFDQQNTASCISKITTSTESSCSDSPVKSEFLNKTPVREVTIIGSQMMTKNSNYIAPSCMFDRDDVTPKNSESYESISPGWSGNTFQNTNAYSNKNENYLNLSQQKTGAHSCDGRYNQKKITNSGPNFNLASAQSAPYYSVNFHTQLSNNCHIPSKNSAKEQSYSFDVYAQENSKINCFSTDLNRQRQYNNAHYNSSRHTKNFSHQNSPLNEAQYPTSFRTPGYDFHHNNGGSDGFKSDNSPGSSTFSTSP